MIKKNKFNLNKNWYHVIYNLNGGVKVCRHMSQRASWTFTKVNDAVNFLRKKIKNKDYEIVIHNKDGSVRRMVKVTKPIAEEVRLKKMSPEQEEHLKLIINTFSKSMDTKYRKGQQEHGGDLWRKKGLVDMAIEEALDQVCYLVTLKRQLEEAGIQLGDMEDKDVIQRRGN